MSVREKNSNLLFSVWFCKASELQTVNLLDEYEIDNEGAILLYIVRNLDTTGNQKNIKSNYFDASIFSKNENMTS